MKLEHNKKAHSSKLKISPKASSLFFSLETNASFDLQVAP